MMRLQRARKLHSRRPLARRPHSPRLARAVRAGRVRRSTRKHRCDAESAGRSLARLVAARRQQDDRWRVGRAGGRKLGAAGRGGECAAAQMRRRKSRIADRVASDCAQLRGIKQIEQVGGGRIWLLRRRRRERRRREGGERRVVDGRGGGGQGAYFRLHEVLFIILCNTISVANVANKPADLRPSWLRASESTNGAVERAASDCCARCCCARCSIIATQSSESSESAALILRGGGQDTWRAATTLITGSENRPTQSCARRAPTPTVNCENIGRRRDEARARLSSATHAKESTTRKRACARSSSR